METSLLLIYSHLWVVSNFSLLWIMRLQTFVCRFLCRCTCSFALEIYVEVKVLSHIIVLCLKFWEISKLFSKVVIQFYIYTVYEGSNFLFLSTLVIFCYIDCSHLSEVVYQTFWFVFLYFLILKHTFMCLLDTCMPSWEEIFI